MFKKFAASASWLWLLALIIIIEGLMLANLELAPMPKIRQPAVLGVKTESNVADVEFLPESLSPTVIDEIKNKIQQKIETTQIEEQTSAADQETLNKSTESISPLVVGDDFKSGASVNLLPAQNQNINILPAVDNDESFARQNNFNETAMPANSNAPVLAEEKSASDGKIIKKEANIKQTEEQLKIEEINNILNQPEPKINLKKYQPASAVEIFNPIKELIKKNIEIFKTLTE